MSSLPFLAIVVGIILLSLRKGSDLLSPARVYGFVWAVSLWLTGLKLSALQHVWTAESWIVILVAVAGFLIGTFIGYVQNVNADLVPVAQMRQEVRRTPIRSNRLFLLIILSFVLYAVSYAVVYMVKGFIPLFSLKGALSRTEFQVFGFGVVLHSVVFIVFFSVLYHMMTEDERLKRFILKVVSVVAVVTFFFLLQRFQLIMAAVMCMALLYYMSQHLRVRNTLVYIVILVVFFYWVSSIRTGQVLQYYLYASSKMKVPAQYVILTEPYMYISMNLENMAKGIERLETFTFGYYSFDFLTAITGVKHWVSEYFGLEATPFLNSSYNTYTSFWPYYRDFGVIGLAAVQLLLGWGISAVYYSMRRAPTVSNIAFYCIAVFVMFISFSQSPLGFLWFAYDVFMIYLILRLTRADTEVAATA